MGSGAAAVYFQMSTGRMPAKEVGAENTRKPTTFSDAQIYAIGDYIASLGGGPAIPVGTRCRRGPNIAAGEQPVHRLNCARATTRPATAAR